MGDAEEDADVTRIYAEGICFFHGVDAKNVGATGTSPHVADLTRI
jgi:hypothetical protein